jgi:hypothetical protein
MPRNFATWPRQAANPAPADEAAPAAGCLGHRARTLKDRKARSGGPSAFRPAFRAGLHPLDGRPITVTWPSIFTVP